MKKTGQALGQYIALLLVCALLSGCTQLFFYPQKPHVTTPKALGYDYQDVFMRTSDGTKVHAWLIEPKPPYRGTVYFLHGNAQNISTHFGATLWLLNNGYQVFGLDYRGYGLSEGIADVPFVFADIDAGAEWITAKLQTNEGEQKPPLFLFGQSLGGALAIKFAQLDPEFSQRFDGLITEAAFSRYGTIARHVAGNHWLTWAAQYPAQWFMTREYDPLDAMAELHGIPKLLIHSKEDDIIPYRFGRELFEAAPEPRYWITASGPHIRAAADVAVRQQMLDFMQRYAHQETPPAH